MEDALLCVQKIEGVHEDDRFTEERHMVNLAVEIERLERQRDIYWKMCERAYSIAMGDADPTEVDDFIADFEAMESPENEKAQTRAD